MQNSIKTHFRPGIWLSTLCMGLALSGPALAQTAGDDSAAIEEIMVTAQKREQALIDVPISITAMTSEEIDARNISHLIEAMYTVPGLTLSEFGPGQQRAQLRGVAAGGGSTGLATVGFYLDEIPINLGSASALDVRLLDMARVEVLRGPQPTLYGEGSMGGTVRYVTADPDLSGFSGKLSGRWGSITDGSGAYRASGVLNIPLVDDTLGLRLVAATENTGGWIDRISNGATDINDVQIDAFRAKLLYQPNDQLTMSLLVQRQDLEQTYQNFAMRDRRTNAGIESPVEDTYDLFNAVISYDFGNHTLLGSIGYVDREASRGADVTGIFINPVIEGVFMLPPGTVTGVGLYSAGGIELPTAEIRLSSNGEGRFNYLAGVYYRESTSENLQFSIVEPDLTQIVPGYFDLFASPLTESKSEAVAAFFEVSYDFTDKITGTIGGRYYEDDRIAPSGETAKFDTFNPKLNISYSLDNGGIVFFNYATGFRSGGFTQAATLPPIFPVPPPPTYGPDEIFQYEIGTKQVLFDKRVTAEISVYYNDWQDRQSPTLGYLPFNVIGNGESASGPGLDLALTAAFTDNLTGSLTYGYVGMEIDADGGPESKGDPLSLVSENTYSISLDYASEISAFGGSDFSARIDYQHTDGYSLILGDFFPPLPETSTGGRDIINLRAGLDFGDFDAYLYVENATDDDGVIYPEVASLPEPVITRPRTVGLGFNVHF